MDSRAKRALSVDQAELLRQIPSVDELLAQPRLASLAQRVDREVLVEITRTVLADLRGRITGEAAAAVLAVDSLSLEERIASMVERVLASSLEPVINATGVILHTNLGRAPLSAAVVEEFRRSATSYSNLEYDLEAGVRGKRDVHTAQLLERLTRAEAAIVVNNCDAARSGHHESHAHCRLRERNQRKHARAAASTPFELHDYRLRRKAHAGRTRRAQPAQRF